MSPRLAGLSLTVLVALGGVGCQEELQALRSQQDELLAKLAELRADHQQLVARVENENRAMWSQQLCKSGKVSEFIADVQAGVPGVCTPGSLEAALTFLNGLPYAVASFRPGIDTITLPLSREGQLRDLLDLRNLHPSTRLVILVQPHVENDEGLAEAQVVATKYLTLMRSLVPSQAKLRFLGPYLLPCRMRSEVSRRFHGPMDRPVPGEPPERAARIRVWAFRTDC